MTFKVKDGLSVAGTNAVIDASGNVSVIGAVTGASFNSITGLSSAVGTTLGTAAVGTSTTVARSDHVHPIQTLTRGTYLTGANYNGSLAATWAVDADTANSASKIVARDASGNFSAGTITAALTGSATQLGGIVASSYVRTDTAQSITARKTFSGNQASAMATATGSLGAFEVYGDGTNAAFIAFHRPGAFASYLGIDTDNVLKYGGWSESTNAYPVVLARGTGTAWNISVNGSSTSCTGNSVTATTLATARTINGVSFNGSANISLTAPTPAAHSPGSYISGSAFDGSSAQTWSVNATTASTGSTVVARDGAGDINVRLVRSEYQNEAYCNGGLVFRVNNTTDNYMRTCSDPAAIRGFIGAYSSANPSGFTSNAGTVTSVTASAPVVSSGGTAPSISMAAASSGVNGYMTGAYATKLDGIAAGATAISNTNQLTNGAGFITSSGRAYPRRSDGNDLNFYWSGQSGQPTWLWGGSDGINMYVYNPSNFSVNYATSAQSAGYATNAGSAGYATSAGSSSYASTAAEATNNYFYVRGTSPTIQFVDTDQGQSRYVHHNGGSIGFLNSAGGWVLRCDDSTIYGSFSGSLSGNASSASNATYSGSAGSAGYATYAGSAGYATSAGSASSATNATYAGNSGTVGGQTFSYSNADNAPSYLWATNTSGSNFLAARGSISVNYANGADSSNRANQLQSFTEDNFTGGDHYIKAIRESGWTTRLKTCYNGGAATSNDVRVGYADSAGSATNAGYASSYAISYSNDSNATYQMLWGSGNLAYGTGGIYCNPATDSIFAVGNITAYANSDARLKENINDIESPLEKVIAIGGKTYDWTDEYLEQNGGADDYFFRKQDFGVIAQDVEAVFPVAVRTKETGTLAVDYEKLVALSFAAIKELNLKVEALQKQLNSK